MSRRCPKCQTENRDQAKRCLNCNYVLAETPVRMCSAGSHVMDPGWTTCPYCCGNQADAQVDSDGATSGRAATLPEGSPYLRQPTVPEKDPMPKMPSPPPAPGRAAGSARRKTVFGDGSISTDELPTIRNFRQPSAARRIVAVLVTYTWRPEGEVFPVREGRNYIGSDSECEVCLQDDPQISNRHATIIYRGKGTQFIIDDEKSMNGTFLNDRSVDTKTPLANYAKIKTGATTWTFILLEPESAEVA